MVLPIRGFLLLNVIFLFIERELEVSIIKRLRPLFLLPTLTMYRLQFVL